MEEKVLLGSYEVVYALMVKQKLEENQIPYDSFLDQSFLVQNEHIYIDPADRDRVRIILERLGVELNGE